MGALNRLRVKLLSDRLQQSSLLIELMTLDENELLEPFRRLFGRLLVFLLHFSVLSVGPGAVVVVVAGFDGRRRSLVLAILAAAQLDTDRLGGPFVVAVTDLDTVVPTADVDQMPTRILPEDAIRVWLVGDGCVLELPAVDGCTVHTVLENDPITTERTCHAGTAITFPTGTCRQEEESREELCDLHSFLS